MKVLDADPQLAQGKLMAHPLLCLFVGTEGFADAIVNLGWFVDTAVVSEVLLFRLHFVYSLLLGSVLQPGDGAIDPLQQLEAEMTMRRKQK